MKSKFKHLVVSGCSFTHQPTDQNYSFAWPNILAEDTGMQVHNLAIPGAGNSHISKSLVLFLEKNNFKPEETLVMAMWTSPSRIDWITGKELSNFDKCYPFIYDYDEFNELVLGGNWWNMQSPKPVQKALIEYSKFQTEQSLTLNSWLAMNQLSSYLEVKNYTYFYTSYISYEYKFSTNEPVLFDYISELKKIDLNLDTAKWLKLSSENYYGDWAKSRDFCDASDQFHPKYPEANEGWTRQIVIPYLKDIGIIYE